MIIHQHLEGALSPQLLFKLADRNGIKLPSKAEDPSFQSAESLLARYDRFTSLDDFLHYYFIGMSCMIHVRDFEELAYEYFSRANADGVAHAEIFFDPQAHTGRNISFETVLDGFTTACERARQDFGITSLLIPCILRHLPVADAEKSFNEMKKDFDTGKLAAIGLDSSEKGYPPGAWKGIYDQAKALGIRRTAHAGEEGPVEYIREAVQQLAVERVDHGIRLAEDESLMRDLAQERIMVTMCPLSNVRLKCVKAVSDLPIKKFIDNGVRFSLNGDDPAYFGGYILDNYCAVQEAFDLRVEDWKWITSSAIEGSWCTEQRKKTLRGEVERVFLDFAQH